MAGELGVPPKYASWVGGWEEKGLLNTPSMGSLRLLSG